MKNYFIKYRDRKRRGIKFHFYISVMWLCNLGCKALLTVFAFVSFSSEPLPAFPNEHTVIENALGFPRSRLQKINFFREYNTVYANLTKKYSFFVRFQLREDLR